MSAKLRTATRRDVLAFALGGAALVAALPFAVRVQAKEPTIYTGLVSGVGAGGYDVVAYLSEQRAVRGSSEITADYMGATWRFSSAANRDLFAANPSKYAPQYGGYCAWAAAEGYTAKGDPKHWSVVDGKLYLNYNGRIKRRWERDIPGNIARGNANWPGILNRS